MTWPLLADRHAELSKREVWNLRPPASPMNRGWSKKQFEQNVLMGCWNVTDFVTGEKLGSMFVRV
jgi:hypothetical protein